MIPIPHRSACHEAGARPFARTKAALLVRRSQRTRPITPSSSNPPNHSGGCGAPARPSEASTAATPSSNRARLPGSRKVSGIENPEQEEINRRHSAPGREPQQPDPDARIQRSYGQKEEHRRPAPEISSQEECWGMRRDVDRHQACAEEHVQADGRDAQRPRCG